jgi:hypothetical protein
MYVCVSPRILVRQLLQNFESLTDLQSRRLLTLLRISVFYLLRFRLFPRLLVVGDFRVVEKQHGCFLLVVLDPVGGIEEEQ